MSIIHQELDDLEEEIRYFIEKRRKLISMNFASAKHLQQTHSRYWNTIQDLALERKKCQEKYDLYKSKYLEEVRLYLNSIDSIQIFQKN